MAEHQDPWIAQELRREELRERRAQWEQERVVEAEKQEREQKQAALTAYLKRRGEDYLDYTGAAPPQHVLDGWTAQYLAAREAGHDLEHERRVAKANQAHYRFSGR